MMGKLLTAAQVGQPICQALGLDGKLVKSLTLRLVAGEMPSLVVEQLILDDDRGIDASLGCALTHYELTLKDAKP